MRLCHLDLIAFGPFEGMSLDLSEGEHGLHVIYGDNERGKSTALRAIRGLLFGIEERTTDDHRFKKAQLRVGARLRRSTGEELAVVRRKGRKGTLQRADSDEPLSDDALEAFLQGLSEPVFSRLYGIDYEELISGGKAILEQSGDVGKAIYAAATGVASLKRALDEVEQEADQLFKPRATKSRIHATVTEHLACLREATAASLSSSRWSQLHQDHDDAARCRAELEEARRALKQELAQRERIKRVRPALAARAELQAALDAMGAVVDLPEDFEQERREALDRTRSGQERLLQISAKVEQLQAAMAAAQPPGTFLEHADTVERLYRKLGAYEKAQQDRPAQDAKLRQHTNDARELLKVIRPGLDLAEAETMRPLQALAGSIRKLESQHEQLAHEEQHAERVLREARERITRVEGALDRAQEHRDATRLAAAINAAQRAGELDAQIQEARERCEQRHEQARLALSRLGLWPGTLEELEAAPLPRDETIEVFETRLQEATRRDEALTVTLEELGRRREELQEKLATLDHGGQIPTTDELATSRGHRDRGWSLVRRSCFDGEDVTAELQGYTEGRPLPDVYEEAARHADAVADQLRADADRVQQHELLSGELAKCLRQEDEVGAARDAQRLLLTEIQREWRQLWTPLGLEPRSPKEMGAWRRQAEALRVDLEGRRLAEGDRDRLVERRADLTEALAAELGAPASDTQPDGPLGTVLERALLVRDELNAGFARARELENALQEARAALARAEAEHEALVGRRHQWRRAWGEMVRDFDFLPEPGVARVVATLEQLAELFKALDKAGEQRRRLYGIDQVLHEYVLEVDRVAEVVGRLRRDQPVEQYVEALTSSLTEAREAETTLQGLRQQREELDGEAAALRAQVRAAETRLAELRRLARVDTDEELHEAGQRAARARGLRSQIELREQQVLSAGDGRSIEELRAQARAIDGDELDSQIARLQEELDSLDQQRTAALTREAELGQQIAAQRGAATAAEATERAEQALSLLREQVRTYLRLRAAALILKNQIETYRREHQAPVLTRAGELFARLTCGSFRTLRDELDSSGQPILLGVKADNREIAVAGMSDGTRDQLYLALRLATLEQHLAQGEPMPFIVDDILVGFDDQRTAACLAVLGELAVHTQVLLFTHHRRVVELARASRNETGAVIHELGG